MWPPSGNPRPRSHDSACRPWSSGSRAGSRGSGRWRTRGGLAPGGPAHVLSTCQHSSDGQTGPTPLTLWPGALVPLFYSPERKPIGPPAAHDGHPSHTLGRPEFAVHATHDVLVPMAQFAGGHNGQIDRGWLLRRGRLDAVVVPGAAPQVVPPVATRAQPPHRQRVQIVVMVPVDADRGAAYLTRTTNQSAAFDGIMDRLDRISDPRLVLLLHGSTDMQTARHPQTREPWCPSA